jgi:hypothetical protein
MMVMGDYLLMNIKGYFFKCYNLGNLLFCGKRYFEYYVNNLSLHKDKRIEFTSTAGADFIGLIIINLLMIILRGSGYAWVVTRTMKFIFDHIELGWNDLNTLQQTEENFKDATGDDISDF